MPCVKLTCVAHPPTVWYTSWKNRGYLSPTTVRTLPIVPDRWKVLSEQLTKFKQQQFVQQKP